MTISKTQLWVAWAGALVDKSVGGRKVSKGKYRLKTRSGSHCCLGVGLLVAEDLGVNVPDPNWRKQREWSDAEQHLFGISDYEHDCFLEKNDGCRGWGTVLEHMQECAPTVRARSQIKKIIAEGQ